MLSSNAISSKSSSTFDLLVQMASYSSSLPLEGLWQMAKDEIDLGNLPRMKWSLADHSYSALFCHGLPFPTSTSACIPRYLRLVCTAIASFSPFCRKVHGLIAISQPIPPFCLTFFQHQFRIFLYTYIHTYIHKYIYIYI